MNRLVAALMAASFLLLASPDADAQKFMSLKQAIKRFLPEGAKPSKVKKTIPDNQFAKIREKFQLVDHGEFKEQITKGPYTIYMGRDSGGAVVVYIMILEQNWRTCYHKYAVALSPAGEVTEVVVVELNCPYANPINRKSFLGQFKGKDAKDAQKHVQIGDDVDIVTGATMSSDVTAIITRRALALFDVFFKQAK